ncbi:MAG: PocR ligand-binding domain-containing protein [Desulfoprunum sp.]|nr:PocR ligand-binding domain-containing protein [Desulfoprunum sp.]
MSNYTFAQLVDVTEVRQLLESHHSLTGMAYSVFDSDENNLVAVGWQDICVQFQLVNPVRCVPCRESDTSVKSHLLGFEGDVIESSCANGMIDVALPIVIEGKHMATFCTGQFFCDTAMPDTEYFRTQAETLGFDTDEYFKALGRVPLFSSEYVRGNMLFLANMINVLARSGLNKLRDTRSQLSAVLNTIPDPIWLKNTAGVYLACNPAFEKILGCSESEIVGKTDHDFVDAALADYFIQKDREAVAAGRLCIYEEEVAYAADGHRRILENCKIPFYGPDGHMLGVLGIAHDITERKRMEEALRESEKTLRGFMENMPAGCIWTDIDGNIEYMNKYFVELLGYTLNETPTIEVLFERIFPDPEQRARIHAVYTGAFAKAAKAMAPFQSLKTRMICKDGSSRHVIVNAHPVRTHVIAVLTDITEREHIQNELLKAQKLEALGVLAGGIAHDFNNILTGVVGHILLAQKSLDTTSEMHKSLEIARTASLRATELTQRLVSFTKGDVLIKKHVSVRGLVNESVSLVVQEGCVQGNVYVPDTLHDIEADEGQISRLFNNIVINAVESMPSGGTLTVQADNANPDECEAMGLLAGRYIRISFTDEGCGITEEDQKKIFDPYFTVKAFGTGLGLASCHSIVAKHGGRIFVSSVVGTGTTFTIYLPSLGNSLQEDSRDTQAEPVQRLGGTVLVMDDNNSIRRVVEKILRRIGYRATVCVDGQAAVALYKEAKEAGTPFDAVIVDLTVPNGMGGEEAARHMLEYDPEARLIVSSGYTINPIIDRYAEYGFSDFLAKPYSIGQLTQVLDNLCQRETSKMPESRKIDS